MGTGRSAGWVAVAVVATVLCVVHAIGAFAAVFGGPDLITVTSLLFIVVWCWIATGAWHRSAARAAPHPD